MNHIRTVDAANGQWRGILMELGVPGELLGRGHGPCPMCGGKDRFRFDNKQGKGTWICNNCGAGDGIALASRFLGKGFADVACEIDKIVGNQKFERDAPAPEMSETQRRAALNEVWKGASKVEAGDPVDTYLKSRGLGLDEYPDAIRCRRSLRDGEGGIRPAMVAMVFDAEGKPRSLHRTFLRPDGKGKAEMASPRKMMAGAMPEGACVRLSGPVAELCIAEGIETAMACERLFETPCWAAISANGLATWVPPAGLESLTIFGDNDSGKSYAGQAAAYALAKRMAAMGIDVNVRIPEQAGWDWADVWANR